MISVVCICGHKPDDHNVNEGCVLCDCRCPHYEPEIVHRLGEDRQGVIKTLWNVVVGLCFLPIGVFMMILLILCGVVGGKQDDTSIRPA